MLLCACLFINIVDVGTEYLMLAVFRPGLAYHLKLHICGIAHACFLTCCNNCRISKIFLQRLHLIQVKGQKPLFRKLLKGFIIHGCKVKVLYSDITGNHFIRIEGRELFCTPLFSFDELCLLHQRVVERLLHCCNLLIGKSRPFNKILHCCLNHLI